MHVKILDMSYVCIDITTVHTHKEIYDESWLSSSQKQDIIFTIIEYVAVHIN